MSVKVALAGIGNCVSSLVQGVEYYRGASDDEQVPGLMHVRLGGHHVSDLQFVAAFEVDADKVGKDLSEAIWAGHNNTIKFSDVPHLGLEVLRGPTLDGLGEYYLDAVEESPATPVDVAQALRDSGADVLACYLPVGSEEAVKFYAQAALDAGVAFVNAVPVFVASDPDWAAKFVEAGLPIVGDDIKSQVGATITHRVMAHLMESRGIALDHTGHDGAMFLETPAGPPGVGQRQSPDAVELRLGLVNDFPGVLVTGRAGEQDMQRLVRPKEAGRIVRLHGGRLLGQVGAQGAPRRGVDAIGAQLDDAALERLADEVIVAHGLQIDAGNESADLRNDVEEPVFGQPLEGFPDRRSADAESFGNSALGHRGARLELHRHDPVAQLLIDVGANPPDRRARGAKVERCCRARHAEMGWAHVH